MSTLHIRPHAPEYDGCVLNVTPKSAGWRYVGFSVHKLSIDQSISKQFDGRETCIVFLSGVGKVWIGGESLGQVGNRTSVFDDDAPHSVYIPADTPFAITALSVVEVALCTAPGSSDGAARIIDPGAVSIDHRGEGSNARIVRNILPETEEADSLLIAEVITPSGHWSSYPPHKHDSDRLPEESALEETYYHRINPSQGFAVQRVYTDDRSIDETFSVDDGDVVLVPRGYHPVGAPHGYDVYYLNVMAGPKRTWLINNDPAHEWIINKPNRE